ncbi:DUF6464 family protein [Leptolyngbya sp. Heron Island J]|uniref:DUF6464 family protein n=1 Tax=Leptolyngbya sp. Heron Island J TaxID=1385935 RepID=UPI00190F49D4|nr:DUF6464 family protein [Leptolyngbya sp. Heron Island J]
MVSLILIGLLPPALSVWATYRAERRVVDRFDLAIESAQYPTISPWRQRDPDEHYIDGIGLVIGDITCQLNARSPHIRCAVNPMGPCEECRSYEGRTYDPPILDS